MFCEHPYDGTRCISNWFLCSLGKDMLKFQKHFPNTNSTIK